MKWIMATIYVYAALMGYVCLYIWFLQSRTEGRFYRRHLEGFQRLFSTHGIKWLIYLKPLLTSVRISFGHRRLIVYSYYLKIQSENFIARLDSEGPRLVDLNKITQVEFDKARLSRQQMLYIIQEEFGYKSKYLENLSAEQKRLVQDN